MIEYALTIKKIKRVRDILTSVKDIFVCTDGAAKGNPGPGGFGAIVVRGNEVVEIGGGKKHTTNNEMELRAVVEALTFVGKTKKSILLYTDSKYVVEGATKWISGWVKNGWKTKTHTDVLNKTLWKQLAVHLDEAHIAWHKIPGHSGMVGNTRADAIASAFGKGMHPVLFKGSIEEYPYDILNVSFDEEVARSRSEARKRQSEKAYSYISEVDGVVMVHTTWNACEARVRGKRARFKKALSAEEEKTIIATFKKT